MLYDILAIQYMYGANMTTRAGDDVYTVQHRQRSISSASGTRAGTTPSTCPIRSATRSIDLRAGTFSSIGVKNNGQTGNGNVAIAFNVTIEDAIGGSGHDKITGK